MNKREFGNKGEQVAVGYLKDKGYKIVEKNYRCALGEIDIIAKKRGDLYFIEVKSRKNMLFGDPLESITLNKQGQIIKIARYFICKHKKDVNCHFSAIGISFDANDQPSINFLPDAFQTC